MRDCGLCCKVDLVSEQVCADAKASKIEPLQITETLDSRPCPGSPGLLELLEHLGADPA